MIIFPAIDLQNGACVRLKQGDLSSATVYNTDPVKQAESFADLGAQWIHIVDLDAAETGQPVHKDLIKSIRERIGVKIQIGGGIRDAQTAEDWLSAGIDRIIIGTLAVKEPETVMSLCRDFPDRIAVGLDAFGDKIAISGWTQTTDHNLFDLATDYAAAGADAIIYTDITRDGLLTGLNFETTRKLANTVNTKVIASGGLKSIDDIKTLLEPENQSIHGAITGKAIYDGRLDLKQALDLSGAITNQKNTANM